MYQKIQETKEYLDNLGIDYYISYCRGERITSKGTILGFSKSGEQKRYKLVDNLEKAKFSIFVIKNVSEYGESFLQKKLDKIDYLHLGKSNNEWYLFMEYATPPKEARWVDVDTNRPCTLLSISEYVRWLRDIKNVETTTGTISYNCYHGNLDYWVSGMSENGKLEQRYVLLNEKAQKFIPFGNEEYTESQSGIKVTDRKLLSKELQEN